MNKIILKSLPLVLIVAIALPSLAFARVVKTVRTNYYAVPGKTQREIIRNIKRYSPIKQKGKTFHGCTSSQFTYHLSWIKKGNVCSIKKVTINLNITYLYPKLAQSQTRKMRDWWDKYMRELKIHEEIHGKIAMRAAHDVDRSLQKLQNQRCPEIKKKAKQKFEHMMQILQRQQEEYDRITQHGKKQERWRGLSSLK